MVSTEHESKQIKLEAIEENLSAMVILEKCGTKSSWSAPILGINWVKPKERHQVLRRFLKDWDIKAGIEKGQIRIVEENEEEIKAPELSNETKTKTKIGGDLEW